MDLSPVVLLANGVAVGIASSLAATLANAGRGAKWMVLFASICTALITSGVLELKALSAQWVPFAAILLGVVGWIIVLLKRTPPQPEKQPAGADVSSSRPPFDWSNPNSVLAASLFNPTFDPTNWRLASTIKLRPFRELPAGTRVLRSAVTFFLDGFEVAKETNEAANKTLERSRETILGRPTVVAHPEGGYLPGTQKGFNNMVVVAKVDLWIHAVGH